MRIEEAASSILEIQVQNCNSDPHRIAQGVGGYR